MHPTLSACSWRRPTNCPPGPCGLWPVPVRRCAPTPCHVPLPRGELPHELTPGLHIYRAAAGQHLVPDPGSTVTPPPAPCPHRRHHRPTRTNSASTTLLLHAPVCRTPMPGWRSHRPQPRWGSAFGACSRRTLTLTLTLGLAPAPAPAAPASWGLLPGALAVALHRLPLPLPLLLPLRDADEQPHHQLGVGGRHGHHLGRAHVLSHLLGRAEAIP